MNYTKQQYTKKQNTKKQYTKKQYTKQQYTKQQYTKQHKHKYYIVNCYDKNNKDDLDNNILEKYLNDLYIFPDIELMNRIKTLDQTFYNKNLKNLKILKNLKNIKPFNTYCKYPVKLPSINKQYFHHATDIYIFNHNMYWNLPRFYDIPKYLVNMLNIPDIMKIFNKYTITKSFINISQTLSKLYIPETFKINELEKYNFTSSGDSASGASSSNSASSSNESSPWYILRPIDSFGGDDIKYISNKKQLTDAILYYNTHKNYKSHLYKNDVIASEYIGKPLLFKNKKLHLRLYYLVSYTNKIVNCFLLDFGKILTARDPFDMLEPFTKDKHDTHVDSTERDFVFPDDFTPENLNMTLSKTEFTMFYNNIFNKIKSIFSILSRIIENNKKVLLYTNEKNAYHIFGADLMIEQQNNNNIKLPTQLPTPTHLPTPTQLPIYIPKLIEVNEAPGFSSRNNNNKQILSNKIYGWLNETVLEPLLKYNNPLLARQHKTYVAPYVS